jgi:hypothetical protein
LLLAPRPETSQPPRVMREPKDGADRSGGGFG